MTVRDIRCLLGASIPLVAAILVLLAPAPGAAQRALVAFETDQVTIETAGGASHEFTVELARTPEQQAQGLMFRQRMPADAGMLFIFSPIRPASFWMKNTAIPLDILFIAPGGRIDQIAERTVPFSTASIQSKNKVAAVLELNAGTVKRLGIAPGDRVAYSGL